MKSLSRSTAAGGALLALTLTTTGCGILGASAQANTVEVWAVEDEVLNPLFREGMAGFNAASEVDVELVTFENDPYKQRLQVAMGSGTAPDVFFNWGGGNLGQYVEAGHVMDLTEYLEENPEFRSSFVPNVLEVAELDGRNYGVPILGMQPVVLFYNRAVFDDADAEPPQTLAELFELVDLFQQRDVTPVVLPGMQSWTMLMWVSYLVDRIGGPDVYADIVANEEEAWAQPAVMEAMEVIQELSDRGAFGSAYQAVTYDGGAASTLLAEGEGAMLLMGAWEIQTQAAENPEFLESGDLGWVPFPEVEGGEGDPEALVGPPSNFLSVNNESLHADVGLDWLREYLTSDAYIDGLIANGAVPAVVGIEEKLADTDQAEFTTWLYELVQEAPTFTPAWDQDLDPGVAETMLTSFELIFEGEMPPEEFAVVMSETQWE